MQQKVGCVTQKKNIKIKTFKLKIKWGHYLYLESSAEWIFAKQISIQHCSLLSHANAYCLQQKWYLVI